jgi:hypothetical protein
MEPKRTTVTYDEPYYIFKCPHCSIYIMVEKNQLNCKIFRCGIYKKTGKQIPPHSKKEICDKLKKNNLIYGCGKPFKYVDNYIESCSYI